MRNGDHRHKVSTEQATIIAALIGLLGVLAATLLPMIFKSDGKKPALELSDVNPSGRGPGRVFLDAKIRNIGSETSIIKRAVVHVSDWRTIDQCLPGAPLPVTSKYKITLPADPPSAEFDTSADMNEFLKPNDATRVRIEIGLDEDNPPVDAIIFRFTLQLDFNADRQATSGPLVISLPGKVSPPQTWKEMRSDPGTRECAEANLGNLRYMLGLPGRRIRDLDATADALDKLK